MIDAMHMSTVWAHDSLTIMACTSVFDNWCVMFCNSVSITTHTDMLVMRNHRRDDGGIMMVAKLLHLAIVIKLQLYQLLLALRCAQGERGDN